MSSILSPDPLLAASSSTPDSSAATVAPAAPVASETLADRLFLLWVARLVLSVFGVPDALRSRPAPAGGAGGDRFGRFPLPRFDQLGSDPDGQQRSVVLALLPPAPGLVGKSGRARRFLVQERAVEAVDRLERELAGRDWREGVNPSLAANVDRLGSLLGLSATERLCFAFLVLVRTCPRLTNAVNVLLGPVRTQTLVEHLARTLDLPSAEARAAFNPRNRLLSSGLLEIAPGAAEIDDKVEWISRSFPDQISTPDFDVLRALRDRIVVAAPPELAWEAFAYLGEVREVTLRYLQAALERRQPAVNVLISGPPGGGKTQFVRALARQLGCALYEVSTEDSDGDPIDGSRRLQALRVAQTFCGRERSILLFDEVEDIFPAPHPLFGTTLRVQRPKGWINRALETNPCVTFWLTNAPAALDPAISRRFSLVWEIKGPPATNRAAAIREFGLPLSPQTIAALSARDDVSIAVLRGAAEVVNTIRAAVPEDEVSGLLERLVGHKLQAQRLAPLRPAPEGDAAYDPTLVNTPHDLRELAEGLRQARRGRVCLYGQSGSGKTAYGRWLGHYLGRPVHLKRASDLLSPYVGEAERSVAAAFRSAEEAGALLLIDEVDTFLQDRRSARNSWEVSLVNEFLTQMEAFEGYFVATTNLLETAEPAAFRRFDFTARFDALRPDQAVRLLETHLRAARLDAPAPGALARLGQWGNLTLGDFAAVARQARFRPLRSAEAWVDALGEMARLKVGPARPLVGFAASAS